MGLAHIGFVLGLEEAGVRFAGLAGTSAGSIAAAGMVCIRGDDLRKAVGWSAFDIVRNMPLSDFIDGPPPVRLLLNQLFSGRYQPSFSSAGQFVSAIRLLFWERGLNPGDAFEEWLGETFARFGVSTCDRLVSHLDAIGKTLSTLDIKNKGSAYGAVDLLKIVSTAVPAGIKLEFPRDMNLLQAPYGTSSPSLFVRASMSIPGFFRPKFLTVDPVKWRARIKSDFREIATENQINQLSETTEIAMVDGGLLSNLPVDAFDTMAELPTVVLTLIAWDINRRERLRSSFKALVDDVATLADAVRLQRDRDALNHIRNLNQVNNMLDPDQRSHPIVLVAAVDTQQHHWLNFNMNESESMDLLFLGLQRARKFIETDIRTFSDRGGQQ